MPTPEDEAPFLHHIDQSLFDLRSLHGADGLLLHTARKGKSASQELVEVEVLFVEAAPECSFVLKSAEGGERVAQPLYGASQIPSGLNRCWHQAP